MRNKSKLQDEDEMRRWAAEGRSGAWVGREYEKKYGVSVSRYTTNRWLNKFGRDTGRKEIPTSWNPWKRTRLRSKTSVPRAMQRLGWLYRYQEGKELSRTQLEAVGRLLVLLEGDPRIPSMRERVRRKATALVIDYDPVADTDSYVPRRHGIDKGWIREPWFADDGSRRSFAELDELSVRGDALRDFLIRGA